MMGGGVWTTPACLGGHNGLVSDVESVDGGTQPPLVRLATRSSRSVVSQSVFQTNWQPALTRESGVVSQARALPAARRTVRA